MRAPLPLFAVLRVGDATASLGDIMDKTGETWRDHVIVARRVAVERLVVASITPQRLRTTDGHEWSRGDGSGYGRTCGQVRPWQDGDERTVALAVAVERLNARAGERRKATSALDAARTALEAATQAVARRTEEHAAAVAAEAEAGAEVARMREGGEK